MVIDIQPEGFDVVGIEGGFLVRFTQCRRHGVFVGMPRTAGKAERVSLVGPGSPVLQYHPFGVGDQQAGRAEASPMTVTGGAGRPAVARLHQCRHPHPPRPRWVVRKG
jgi:hypothetical protein